MFKRKTGFAVQTTSTVLPGRGIVPERKKPCKKKPRVADPVSGILIGFGSGLFISSEPDLNLVGKAIFIQYFNTGWNVSYLNTGCNVYYLKSVLHLLK